MNKKFDIEFMVLIVGLGNPEKKFQMSRHNIGFLVIDRFSTKNDFPKFKFSRIYNADISEKELYSKKIILAKPRTFMNNSGRAVKLLIENWKLKIENLILVHDDIDLPLGKIRISKNRGPAGHKGVESIIKELNSKNFIRLRIGIYPLRYHLSKDNIEKFVLQKFNRGEQETVKKVIEKSCRAIEVLLSNGIDKAMNEFN